MSDARAAMLNGGPRVHLFDSRGTRVWDGRSGRDGWLPV